MNIIIIFIVLFLLNMILSAVSLHSYLQDNDLANLIVFSINLGGAIITGLFINGRLRKEE